MSKLNLDRDHIDQCRKIADQIVAPILQQVNRHTSVSIERCVLRLLGVEGTLEEKPRKAAPQGRFPLVNEIVDKIGFERLHRGAGYWFGLASVHHPKLSPSALGRKIVNGDINFDELEEVPIEKIDYICQQYLSKSIARFRFQQERQQKRPAFADNTRPLLYVIVATGNIHEDILQAQAAAEMGADIIAVIRSTAQSLLDYVPEGETTEGFGGTFATQANFRLMRQALDQVEKKLKRRIALTNYSSGLCMSEIAILGAFEGIDYLLNDAMYGILFRDINMKRNFIDQHFARRMCALSGIIIQTGEDNYLTTADSHKYWFQVLASHFINYAFAKRAGISDNAIALGHAHEVDPSVEDSFVLEWAQAQLVREVFPNCPIKYMPPTKHKTGDIFFSYLYDGMFNLASILTGQSIHLLGMHTEAIFNPFVQDRFLSLKNANYVFRAAKSLREEILFQPNGKIIRRARQVLDDSMRLLRHVKARGLIKAIEEGLFANVRRNANSGKGYDGVLEKSRDYYTPLAKYLTPKVRGSEEVRPTRLVARRPMRGRKPQEKAASPLPNLNARDLRAMIRQEEEALSEANIPSRAMEEGATLSPEELLLLQAVSEVAESEESSGQGPRETRQPRSRQRSYGRARSRGREGRSPNRGEGRGRRPQERRRGASASGPAQESIPILLPERLSSPAGEEGSHSNGIQQNSEEKE